MTRIIIDLPVVVHSDQGRSYKHYGYHPQGYGMVEWFNRSLILLQRLYAYHTEHWGVTFCIDIWQTTQSCYTSDTENYKNHGAKNYKV